jgi:hypothetical protein
VFNGLRNHGYLGNFGIAPQTGITAIGGTVTQYPASPRTNYITNPNFETNVSGWTMPSGITASQDSTVAYSGTKSLSFNSGAYSSLAVSNTATISANIGESITFSIYAKIPQNGGYSYCTNYDFMGNCTNWAYVPQTAAVAKLTLTYTDNSYSYFYGSSVSTTNSITQRFYATGTATKTVQSATVSLEISSLSSSQTIYLDSALLEKSSSVLTYFDGSSSDCSWSGTANLSSSYQNTYKVHTFNSSDAFTVLAPGAVYNTANFLVVAGGGGGAEFGGGGGAGGLLTGLLSPTAQSYTVTVGAGGLGRTWPNKGYNGGDSSAFGQTAIGGGGGGPDYGNGDSNGANGGSGGGGMENSNYSAVGGTGVAGQGYAGGAGTYTGSTKGRTGGGGGGAAGVGAANTAGGAGGAGVTSTITGSSVTYAAGGSAGSSSAGAANTGNGGGGSATGGAAGGSGVVIVKYRIA